MQVRRSTASARVSPTPQYPLEITQQKKMLKMKIGPQNILKTQGQKKWSSECEQNKGVKRFGRGNKANLLKISMLSDTRSIESPFAVRAQATANLPKHPSIQRGSRAIVPAQLATAAATRFPRPLPRMPLQVPRVQHPAAQNGPSRAYSRSGASLHAPWKRQDYRNPLECGPWFSRSGDWPLLRLAKFTQAPGRVD